MLDGGNLAEAVVEPELLECGKCDLRTPDLLKGGICRPCSNKRAMLSKMFGCWPINAFKNLSAAQQTEFWATGGGGGCKGDMVTALAKTFSFVEVRRNTDSVGGTFLPLSVLATQGYDAETLERIQRETHPDNIEDHPPPMFLKLVMDIICSGGDRSVVSVCVYVRMCVCAHVLRSTGCWAQLTGSH